MVKKILFIEGTSDDTNGDLRQGFHKLLKQKLSDNMPRIKMGNGITTTIKAFKNNRMSEYKVLLIDLDAAASAKPLKISAYQLNDQQDHVFFMIQEMEGWFFSQPHILDAFYGEEISTKIPKKHFQNIETPAKYLAGLTKNTKKGEYHKVRHGVKLLERLDAEQLVQDSPEFADLIEKLQKM
jgi:hypothetical protein